MPGKLLKVNVCLNRPGAYVVHGHLVVRPADLVDTWVAREVWMLATRDKGHIDMVLMEGKNHRSS